MEAFFIATSVVALAEIGDKTSAAGLHVGGQIQAALAHRLGHPWWPR